MSPLYVVMWQALPILGLAFARISAGRAHRLPLAQLQEDTGAVDVQHVLGTSAAEETIVAQVGWLPLLPATRSRCEQATDECGSPVDVLLAARINPKAPADPAFGAAHSTCRPAG